MSNTDPLLKVQSLRKTFRVKGPKGDPQEFAAVDDISFEVRRGETWGLIGESGSGKSTTGRLVLMLEEPTSGAIHFDGMEISSFGSLAMSPLRRRMQIVFQDSGSAFNPRRRVGEQIGFPLRRFRMLPDKDVTGRVIELLERVGLNESHYDRYIHEFSGGQRQRLGIARALVTNPEFIVLDEPTAALDVSVQAQILNLLKDLQKERGLTMLLITHNLALVEHMCDYAGVLDHGKLIENGPVDDLLTNPSSEITRKLVDAVLEPELVSA